MKIGNLLLGAAVLLFTQHSQAQQTQELTKKALSKLPKGYVQSHKGMSNARTTGATGSRLIQIVDLGSYNGTAYVISDSSIINYSGTRGGDLNTSLKYDNATTYAYNDTTSTYSNGDYYLQTFDANNNILTSLEQYWDIPSSSWINSYNSILTYDASNNILTDISQTWDISKSSWQNGEQYIYTYSAGNKMLTQIVQSWDTTTTVWVNSTYDTYTYDGSGNELTDLNQTWDITTSAWVNNSNETWTYTAANKVATDIYQTWGTSTWVNSGQTLNTYDASNNLTNAVTQYWNTTTTAWDNSYQDTYTYDGSGDQLTDLYQIWGTSSWVNYYNTINSNFVAMQPQSTIYQDTAGGIFVNANKDTFTYNSYNQITSIYTSTWNAGGFWQPVSSDYGERFYYQTYTTSVKNISSSGCSASVYPVPANDRLHVDINWEEAQSFTIEIYDIQGRMIRQWQIPSTQSYNADITLNNLPTGTYLMKIQGIQGQVVKQLVVAE